MIRSKLTFIFITLFFVSSCQLANEAKSLKEKNGSGAFSCGQIKAAFAAYDADRQSADAYLELARLTGLSTSEVNTQKADTYYDTARARANIALVVQGCPPM